MATYLELQNAVLRNLIDTPTSVSGAVPDLINSALRKLQRKHNFKVMEAEQAYTTTANTRAIGAVPSDYKEARGRPYLTDFTGHVRPLVWVSSDIHAKQQYGDDSTVDVDEPQALLDAEPSDESNTRNFEVFPYPDGNSLYSDGEYRITVPYWKYVTALSADGDTNWFTVHAEEWLEFKATSDGFAIDWDEERSAFWAQKANGEYNDVLLADKRFRLAGVKTFVPHKDVHAAKVRY